MSENQTPTLERETFTLALSSGVEVVFYSYLLGRDMVDLESSTVGAGRIVAQKDGAIIRGDDVVRAKIKKEIQLTIKSVQGNEDKTFIYNFLMNMRSPDYRRVMNTVDKIVAGIEVGSDEEKKSN